MKISIDRSEKKYVRTLLTVINDRSYFERHRRHVAEAAGVAGWRSLVAMPSEDIVAPNPYFDERRVDFLGGRLAPRHEMVALFQLVNVLARDEPDLVHAITLKAISLTGLALRIHYLLSGRRIPLICTFPGLGYTFKRQSSLTFRDILYKLFARAGCKIALSWPDLWATFETHHDREQIVKAFGIERQRTVVIQGTGLDLGAFASDEKSFSEPLTLLFAGRLLRSKGVLAFCDAAHLPGASRFRWRIAGWRYDSPDALSEDEVRMLCSSSRIEFLGQVGDMPRLLKETNAVVLPSTYPEGVPRILIEAAASSTPMITTDFPGARELVQDGQTGFIIDEASGHAILQAAEALHALPDHGRAMGRCANGLMLAGAYDHISVQKEFIRIYEAVSRQGLIEG